MMKRPVKAGIKLNNAPHCKHTYLDRQQLEKHLNEWDTLNQGSYDFQKNTLDF